MSLINNKIIKTNDGSDTLESRFLNEHYHSTHGAITEAKHVYIESGFKQLSKKNISILEMGFGTGLNTFLTYCLAAPNLKVVYDTIESEAVSLQLACKLNYLTDLNQQKLMPIFEKLHSCEWNKKIIMDQNFHFTKWNSRIQDIKLHKKYDLVYYDAFGPRVQPELWKKDIFTKIYAALNDDGLLVTYCANGQFKRDLKAVGFDVKSIPGPPGKREITQAFRKKK